ncbi:MAG: hypothetical protein IPN86_21915 [Saprospiraceae bacterium]|nr:hypothetical protein [Saprospiraceae bacterium]
MPPILFGRSNESLEYALSGDNNNAATLCLYGRVYAEQLQDYVGALTR